MFLFWWFCNTFCNSRALIAFEFNLNFRFWERIVINVNRDIEKVFTCLIGVFNFFNVIPISAVQSIFKFVNILFTVRAFVSRFYDWSLRCFMGFNCEDNRKMIWQASFYYGWLKVIVACYSIGDNVFCGICWVSGYPCCFILSKESYYSETWDSESLARFYLFKNLKS